MKTVAGVFRGFFNICTPAGQENFSFPAPSFYHLGVFLPFPDFCSLFVPSTQMRNRGKREQKRKILSKTPNLSFHSPEFLRNMLSEGEQNSRNSLKAPRLDKKSEAVAQYDMRQPLFIIQGSPSARWRESPRPFSCGVRSP